MSTINDNFYTPDDEMNYKENGFNIAAAFTGFDSETEDILDPMYGELAFMHYYWGIQADGNYTSGKKMIKSHKCTPEEIGLNEDDAGKTSKFMPIN